MTLDRHEKRFVRQVVRFVNGGKVGMAPFGIFGLPPGRFDYLLAVAARYDRLRSATKREAA